MQSCVDRTAHFVAHLSLVCARPVIISLHYFPFSHFSSPPSQASVLMCLIFAWIGVYSWKIMCYFVYICVFNVPKWFSTLDLPEAQHRAFAALLPAALCFCVCVSVSLSVSGSSFGRRWVFSPATYCNLLLCSPSESCSDGLRLLDTADRAALNIPTPLLWELWELPGCARRSGIAQSRGGTPVVSGAAVRVCQRVQVPGFWCPASTQCYLTL